MELGVLGPIVAWRDGSRVALRGPRHRAVLARLILARGQVVTLDRLIADLWREPPAAAAGAVRTFIGDLRRALEPERVPRAPARLLVTDGPGYSLRTDAVDAWRFEALAAAEAPARDLVAQLDAALALWRGPAYAELDDDWALVERARLAELRLDAIERRAQARLALGLPAPELDAHVAEHPWREEGWRLLALSLYRGGRQADALAVLRRARVLLVEQLGVEPGPALRRLQDDILHHAGHLSSGAEQVWADTAAAYDRAAGAGARARLESTVSLLRGMAVTGAAGLEAARRQRVAVIAAAEELGDAELTARVIGGYDVPAIWTRSDDPAQATRVVAAATSALPGAAGPARARLLATIALESRGHDAVAAAREAEALAREIQDPRLLAFALNGVWMQTFWRAGLARERDAIGAELIELSRRHGLTTYEVLGHLIRMQARGALADVAAADAHAAAADALQARHELPLIGVFTAWYRALRWRSEAAYREAAALQANAAMPGFSDGLLALALLCLHGRPVERDFGPYEPWARPHVLLAEGRRADAGAAVRAVPDPPRDLLLEALWTLTARAAAAVGDTAAQTRAAAALAPAAHERPGLGSGVVGFGSLEQSGC